MHHNFRKRVRKKRSYLLFFSLHFFSSFRVCACFLKYLSSFHLYFLYMNVFFVILPFKRQRRIQKKKKKSTVQLKCVYLLTMTMIPKYFCQPFMMMKRKYRLSFPSIVRVSCVATLNFTYSICIEYVVYVV